MSESKELAYFFSSSFGWETGLGSTHILASIPLSSLEG